jgi:pyruvate dehydrogenase E1 component alpha subunit
VIGQQYCTAISAESIKDIPEPLLKKMYSTMLRIRMTEEKIAELIVQKDIVCPCHLYIGQESVATGVCANLRKDDHVYSTHRSHGHYLAKGGDLKSMMAELYGKATGCSKGNGGSMHLVSIDAGLPGSSAIVGGTIPIAVGSALAFSLRGEKRVSVAFFGDGAATEGVLYESLNFAALKNLPVIFVCENNFYSTHMHITAVQCNPDIYKRAEAFCIPSYKIDGYNVIEIYKAAKAAVEKARKGDGPTFLECVTYRWRGHVGPDWDIEKGIRCKEEVDWWVNNCGIKKLEDLLSSVGMLSDSERANILDGLVDEIDEAVKFAKESRFPEIGEYKGKVFKDSCSVSGQVRV